MNSTVIMRNTRGLELKPGWSNSNETNPSTKRFENNPTADINVEAILHTNHHHKLRKGAKVRDSLPGIINKFG